MISPLGYPKDGPSGLIDDVGIFFMSAESASLGWRSGEFAVAVHGGYGYAPFAGMGSGAIWDVGGGLVGYTRFARFEPTLPTRGEPTLHFIHYSLSIAFVIDCFGLWRPITFGVADR
jgi:hypothetical protein